MILNADRSIEILAKKGARTMLGIRQTRASHTGHGVVVSRVFHCHFLLRRSILGSTKDLHRRSVTFYRLCVMYRRVRYLR